jgi:lipid II:glycine glycyltransferase (peptidoglycan interpeptide bridge formation enzyme)
MSRRDSAMRYTVTSAEARPDPTWDALVEAAPGGDLTQTTVWALTRQRLGSRVWHLRLHAVDGTLAGGCLIQSRQVLPGIWIGAVPRGPLLFSGQPSTAHSLVREMIAAARRLGIRLLITQPPEGNAAVLEAMAAHGFRSGGPNIAPDATLRTDLRRSEEEILQSVHASRRKRIRDIVRSGLEISSSDDVEGFHDLYVRSAERQGFRPVGIDNLKAQWEVLAPLGMCHLFLVRQNGAPLAGQWATSFAGTATAKLTGRAMSSDVRAARSAATAAIWTCLLRARQQGASTFDFGGFDRKSAEDILAGRDPPAGFADSPSYFKWSFGGDIVLLPKPQFILTGRATRVALTGIVQRLLASDAARRLASQTRAVKRPKTAGAV